MSRRHGFIFVAVPRTGSQAVRAALRPHLGPDDEEQAVWKTKRHLAHEALAALEHGHITAREAMAHLDPELWRRSVTFAFVRDPWDRFLSAAVLTLGAAPFSARHPVECLRQLIESGAHLRKLHFRPQVDFVLDERGVVAVDAVGHVESLAEDFASVMRRVGLHQVTLPRVHVSAPAHRGSWREPELVRWVAERYAADYAAFGYPIPPEAER